EYFIREFQRLLKLKISLEGIVDLLNAAKRFAVERTVQPESMADHRLRKIAAVKNARLGVIAAAFVQMRATIQRNECTDVAVEIRKLAQHRDPIIKVVAVDKATVRSAMGRDHGHAAFQRRPQKARVGKFLIYDRNGVLAAGM